MPDEADQQTEPATWWNPRLQIPEAAGNPDNFTLDPVTMDLRISSLPVDQGWADVTTQYWIEQAERDIFSETVEALGYDPLTA